MVCACEPSTSTDEPDFGALADMGISLDGAMLTDAADHLDGADVQVSGFDLSVETDARTAFDAALPVDVESPGSEVDMGSPMASPQSEYSVEHMDVMVSYQTQRPAPFQNENREMTLRIYYPRALNADARLIVVSHGGPGSERGHMALAHLGQHYASRGYVAAHIGHRSSPGNTEHRWDRPHDVRAVINYFESADGAELEGMNGGVGTDAVGHIGHSWGAYTAHGVAGGDFRVSEGREDVWRFRDQRVVAIVALSPQGPGGFGAYDVVCDRAGGGVQIMGGIRLRTIIRGQASTYRPFIS